MLPEVAIVLSLNKLLKTRKIWIKMFEFIIIKRAKILTQVEIKLLKKI